MDRAAGSGLEVKPQEAGLEPAPDPASTKWYIGGGALFNAGWDHSHPHSQSQAKPLRRSKAFWILAAISIICLAVALGVGIGAGIAIGHRSNKSSPPSLAASEEPFTTTQSGSLTTITPAPSGLPYKTCPESNGSTYVASNQPTPTINPALPVQVTNTSFTFEILCNTDFEDTTWQGGPIRDMQLITNVSALNDCLEECALYNFRTARSHFPAYGCTGISWGKGIAEQQAGYAWPICWLKSNVTLDSVNGTKWLGGYDGAVLLNV